MRLLNIPIILFIINTLVFAQVSYQGPANGSVSEGYTYNTATPLTEKLPFSPRLKLFLHGSPPKVTEPDNVAPLAMMGDNYVADPAYNSLKKTTGEFDPFIIKETEGPSMTNKPGFLLIPSDACLAVGPEHVVAQVNSSIIIYEKSTLNSVRIDPDAMFNQGASVDAFDPRIIYDHFAERWVSLWVHVDDANSIAYYLLAVSDDSNPHGNWFVWVLPSNTNGNTPTGDWADNPALGYDDKAIYISSNQFTFSGNYNVPKIRIVKKSEIYIDSDPSGISWTDIWGINYPGTGSMDFSIRPVIMKSAADDYYFVSIRRGQINNSVAVYTLSNVLSSVVLTGRAVSTNQYGLGFNIETEQPGGSEFPIQHGNDRLNFEPKYFDEVIHLSHEVIYEDKIGVRYLAIVPESDFVWQDEIMGTSEHYHLHSSMDVNSSSDLAFTYGRVSANEYAGAYYNMIPFEYGTFTGSQELIQGGGNYNVTFGGETNRWGDYSGVWTDPSDDNTFWVFSQYARATDEWSTRLGAVRYKPFDQPYIYTKSDKLEFNDVQIKPEGTVKTFKIANFGAPDLQITGLVKQTDFFDLNNVSLPINIASKDTMELEIVFKPAEHKVAIKDTLEFITNDPVNNLKIEVSGSGFELVRANANTLYASTGKFPPGSGRIGTIDISTGEGTAIGRSGFRPVNSITVNPLTDELFALTKSTFDPPDIIKLSGDSGEAFSLGEAPLDLTAMTFDSEGLLHVVDSDNNYYTMNADDFEYTFIKNLNMGVRALAVHPSNAAIYVTPFDTLDNDHLYSLSGSGDLTLIASTGLNKSVQAIAFDANGSLYGVTGNEDEFSTFVGINAATGAGTVIGETGLKGVLGLAYSISGISSAGEYNNLNPNTFALQQNYPNPFNPGTIINFSIPGQGSVKLILFNTIGEQIAVLLNEQLNGGSHRYELGSSVSGNLSSGIYIYKLQFVDAKGKFYSKSNKMMLIK